MGRIRPLEASPAKRAIKGEDAMGTASNTAPGGALTFHPIRFRQSSVNSVD